MAYGYDYADAYNMPTTALPLCRTPIPTPPALLLATTCFTICSSFLFTFTCLWLICLLEVDWFHAWRSVCSHVLLRRCFEVCLQSCVLLLSLLLILLLLLLLLVALVRFVFVSDSSDGISVNGQYGSGCSRLVLLLLGLVILLLLRSTLEICCFLFLLLLLLLLLQFLSLINTVMGCH